jgi:hypothetical protein
MKDAMIQLPENIHSQYRPATSSEIRSWSFGTVTKVRNPNAATWKDNQGTLDDERIFGPLCGYHCACGKYQGRKYENMICDRCGVKITSRECRWKRFGHIDLLLQIPHPLEKAPAQLDAIPVLPAAFRESKEGEKLVPLYDDMVKYNSYFLRSSSVPPAISSQAVEKLTAAFEEITKVLIPMVCVAHEWNLQEASMLARGLALINRTEDT